MQQVARVLVAVLGLLSLAACDLAKDKDPIILSKVKEEFKVSMWEKLAPEGRSFQLRVETLDLTPCQNTQIANHASRSGNVLKLSLLDIAQPEDCNPGSNPALALADYGPLETGSYSLAIDLKQTVINEGRLLVFSDRYGLNMSTVKGLEIATNTLRRVPDGTLWGYFVSENADDQALADALLESLDDFVEARSYTAGDYGYFSIEENSRELLLPDLPDQEVVRPFILHFPGTDEKGLKKQLKEFRENAPEGSRLVVHSWQGIAW